MHAHDGEHPLAPGSLLAGRYRVGERIGSGGTATVHRGRDELLGRDVALKAVTHGASDPAAHERERTEVELLARLSHRALVTVFDAVSARIDGSDSIVVVMELVDGPTLSQRRAEGPIADAELLRMARDLAEALAVVHAAGVVHRDVKPSNILLAPSPLAEHDFDARLADFGIASVDGGGDLTATGAVLGTAAYLSPEQATGGTVGPAADVYALGLVLLETITGEREFAGPAIEALTARMLRDPVMPPTLDERWAWLLRGMTAREPADRPTTDEVRELLAALDGVPVHVAAPAGTDVVTAVVPVATADASTVPVDADADADARTALLPAVGAGADAATSTAPVVVAGADADAEHLPARRRRRIAVLATVGVVLVAGAVGAGALALQGLGEQDAAPSAPADEADRTTPSPTPSPTTSTTPSPTPSPSESPTPTTTAPQPQPTTPATTTPAEPEPTTPTESPAPTETTTPPTEPTAPPTESPAPSESTPPSPAPTP